MTAADKIRVGIIGASPGRGFASIAHIPALQALPEFEITAVCTTRQASAEAAAKYFNIPLAFSDPRQLAQHPEVDLVTVADRTVEKLIRTRLSEVWPEHGVGRPSLSTATG